MYRLLTKIDYCQNNTIQILYYFLLWILVQSMLLNHQLLTFQN